MKLHHFPDHHRFQQTDLNFSDALPIIMTEKDAIKCAAFAKDTYWMLPIDAHLPEAFAQAILTKLKEVR
ncbi:MAG: tetraacyldisaccharide 4'-kinase [Chloroflexota bacterium]